MLHMRFDVIESKGRMTTNRARRMVTQPQTLLGTPSPVGPYRTRRKPAAAGCANILQDGFNAVCAVSAFIGANARIGGIGRQVAVAKFAVGSQFKQADLLEIGVGAPCYRGAVLAEMTICPRFPPIFLNSSVTLSLCCFTEPSSLTSLVPCKFSTMPGIRPAKKPTEFHLSQRQVVGSRLIQVSRWKPSRLRCAG
jgi:hypothetical protein